MNIGDRIKELRISSQMSQQELADKLNVAKQTVYKYENGIVYVKLIGACANCEYGDSEIKDTVESILTSEIPEVLEVRNIASE